MLIGSATTVIALTLIAISALDSPYRPGLGQIKPVAMERSLRILDSARRAVVNGRDSVPCDAARRGAGVSDDERHERSFFDRHFELLATILLAMAAVATAWSGYQSARWRGEQARAQSASIAARVESTRAANVANRQGQIDVALFTQWVDAYARDEAELDAFYRKRFRPEFQPAFNAWVATQPRKNPDAPLSPFALPRVQARRQREAERARGAGHRVLPARRALHPAGGQLLAGRRAVRDVAVLRGHQHPPAFVDAADGHARVRLQRCSSAASSGSRRSRSAWRCSCALRRLRSQRHGGMQRLRAALHGELHLVTGLMGGDRGDEAGRVADRRPADRGDRRRPRAARPLRPARRSRRCRQRAPFVAPSPVATPT